MQATFEVTNRTIDVSWSDEWVCDCNQGWWELHKADHQIEFIHWVAHLYSSSCYRL